MKAVIQFIEKRFKKNCNWVNGNCYYFAVILKSRFPKGEIFYDIINGHFIFYYKDHYYDWLGEVEYVGNPINWNKFKEYDELQYKRIISDCIK
jgi:hypothetical protein